VLAGLIGAEALGKAWARERFIARFGADINPVASAWSGALAYGRDWASRIFTAKFDVNIQPLWDALDAVRYIAKAISDLLPHSPARTGPLSEPISFAWIAEAARRDLAVLPGLLERALAAPSAGGARFGAATIRAAPVYNVNVVKVVTVPPDEWVRVARDAEKGAKFASALPREIDLLLAEV
jgi:hypothetical protein